MNDAILADLLAFLSASPTPFHAVFEARKRLDAVGFMPLDEQDAWGEGGALKPGKYYVTSGGTNLLAFRVPDGPAKGFRLLGAHTDSPNLRLKPKPGYAQEGYLQLGVEVYGGVLLNSWLDRDLGLAGRVTVRERDGSLGSRLMKVDRPLLRVPQLAVHLDRDVNDKGLVLNKQEHMAPIMGLAAATVEGDALLDLVKKETHVDPADVLSFDLMLHDVTPACVAGLSEEFLFSARLDNLAMCHAAISALLSCQASSYVPVIALFDHEEVGSETMHGAGSSFLPRVLERIAAGREAFLRMCASSFFVSADMAHAVHPNYPARHEARHKPRLNAGPVIKVNSQQRYATDGRTAAIFADACRREDVPVQHYAHRTDLPCGTTIGPIVATLLGIPTVDVGNPMLSMHSAREMCGTQDPALMVRVLARLLGEG